MEKEKEGWEEGGKVKRVRKEKEKEGKGEKGREREENGEKLHIDQAIKIQSWGRSNRKAVGRLPYTRPIQDGH